MAEYRDENGHFTSKENDGGACHHGGGSFEGRNVKVKVDGNRSGVIKKKVGDGVYEVELQATDTLPARTDRYYSSDLFDSDRGLSMVDSERMQDEIDEEENAPDQEDADTLANPKLLEQFMKQDGVNKNFDWKRFGKYFDKGGVLIPSKLSDYMSEMKKFKEEEKADAERMYGLNFIK